MEKANKTANEKVFYRGKFRSENSTACRGYLLLPRKYKASDDSKGCLALLLFISNSVRRIKSEGDGFFVYSGAKFYNPDRLNNLVADLSFSGKPKRMSTWGCLPCSYLCKSLLPPLPEKSGNIQGNFNMASNSVNQATLIYLHGAWALSTCDNSVPGKSKTIFLLNN